MTNYRLYFEPMDICAVDPEAAIQKFVESKKRPDIVRVIVAENNVWDHRNE